MPVLVTCALSSAAHRLKKLLNAQIVILGDFAEVPELMVRSQQIIKLPSPVTVTYQHEMLALCLDHNIHIVYPLDNSEKNALWESRQLFAEYGIVIKDLHDDL